MKNVTNKFLAVVLTFFASTINAATLNWASVQEGATITSNNGGSISAKYDFDTYNGDFLHNYAFDLGLGIDRQKAQAEFLGIKIKIVIIITKGFQTFSLDNEQQSFSCNGINCVLNTSLIAGSHTIQLAGNVIPSSPTSYGLKVAQTPLPAAFWLFGSAFTTLSFLSKKRKIKA